MPERNLNNFAQTTIAAPNAVVWTFIWTTWSDDFPASDFYAGVFQVVAWEIITKEIVLCTARVWTLFTVTRWVNWTTAQDFTSWGWTIYLMQVLVAWHIQEIRDQLDLDIASINNLKIVVKNASSSWAASIELAEDTDNGTNKVIVKAPATLASDYTLTLPVDAWLSWQALTTDWSWNTFWQSWLSFGKVVATHNSFNIF